MERFETVLFDIDGTLADSNDAHAAAWVDALAEAGHNVPFAEVRPLIGMGSDKLLPALDRGLSAETKPGKTISERRGAFFKERYLSDVGAMPGACDLVDELRRRNLRCVIASSAKSDELDMILAAAGIPADRFETATTSDDADRSKPDPDIIGAALERSHTPANRAVMVGDTTYDIEAANAAGVPVIALRCGGSPDERLRGAAMIFDSPAAMLAALEAESLESLTRGPSAPAR